MLLLTPELVYDKIVQGNENLNKYFLHISHPYNTKIASVDFCRGKFIIIPGKIKKYWH
jgi:hypothetical protein